MNHGGALTRPRPSPPPRGYVLVLFVVVMAFTAVAAAMQVLVLASVGTTSRAYDAYRQGTTEAGRLEEVVVEALLEQRQTCVAAAARPCAESVAAHLVELAAGGATITPTAIPGSLPEIIRFPDARQAPDALRPVDGDTARFLTPELAWLAGPRVAAYPEVRFEFSSERSVLGAPRTYRTEVRARYVAVPLTRFAVAAYDLPSEIGAALPAPVSGPRPTMPQGLVASRDPAFVSDWAAQPGVLPYYYRRRAVLSAAYQYVFSQRFVDSVAEYAGVTHFRDLDDPAGTAALAGMSSAGAVSTYDVGVAGPGTYGALAAVRDAAVVFTQKPGLTLRLIDTVGDAAGSPLFLLVMGPPDHSIGPLTLEFSSIARPLVIVGCNVRIAAAAPAAVNGALMLDPASSFAPGTSLVLGHLSYWGGSDTIPATTVTIGAMPESAEAIAPRVVYVATIATRL